MKWIRARKIEKCDFCEGEIKVNEICIESKVEPTRFFHESCYFEKYPKNNAKTYLKNSRLEAEVQE